MDQENRRVLPRTGYPRRRAVTACSTCRERKKKCDNLRPSCSFCLHIGARCEYGSRDASTFDPASLTILDRLSVIESLLRLTQPGVPADTPQHLPQPSTQSPSPLLADPSLAQTNLAVWSLDVEANNKVSTASILRWPVFSSVLAPLPQFSYTDLHGATASTPLDDFCSRSARRLAGPLTADLSAPPVGISTERRDIEALVDKYFRRVHIKNPILDHQAVVRLCESYYEDGPQFTLETCLVLIVCALGVVSTEFSHRGASDDGCENPIDQSARVHALRLGSCYFAVAEKRLGAAMTESSTLAVQCLCLAGIYHMYRIDPMAALRMFHAAGLSLQLLISSGADCLEGTSQLNSSLFWTCFKSEREILAELPIGAPALSQLGLSERYPPPPPGGSPSPGEDEWIVAEEDSWYFFLSEIALRRITDKVSEMVFNHADAFFESGYKTGTEKLIPLVQEFERQAHSWRENLPQQIRFPDSPRPADTEWQQYSRGRYYRVLELMYRPFVLAALHDPGCGPVARALAGRALVNASNYLHHCHLTHRHQGLWLQLRNGVKEASLLLLASGAGLEMPAGWYAGVERTLRCIEHWAWEAPFCRSYARVLLALDRHIQEQTRWMCEN